MRDHKIRLGTRYANMGAEGCLARRDFRSSDYSRCTGARGQGLYVLRKVGPKIVLYANIGAEGCSTSATTFG